jgi:hypothetical protein
MHENRQVSLWLSLSSWTGVVTAAMIATDCNKKRRRFKPPMELIEGLTMKVSDLTNCVFRNDVAGVRKQLARGADVNERDRDGRPARIHAAIDGQVEISKALLNGAWPSQSQTTT